MVANRMFPLAAIFVAISFLACASPKSPHVLEFLKKEKVVKYFATIPSGKPVSQIEKDLGLSSSNDMEAPNSLYGMWNVIYRQQGLFISFDAVTRAQGEPGELLYMGNVVIQTEEEHAILLRKMGVP